MEDGLATFMVDGPIRDRVDNSLPASKDKPEREIDPAQLQLQAVMG